MNEKSLTCYIYIYSIFLCTHSITIWAVHYQWLPVLYHFLDGIGGSLDDFPRSNPIHHNFIQAADDSGCGGHCTGTTAPACHTTTLGTGTRLARSNLPQNESTTNQAPIRIAGVCPCQSVYSVMCVYSTDVWGGGHFVGDHIQLFVIHAERTNMREEPPVL